MTLTYGPEPELAGRKNQSSSTQKTMLILQSKMQLWHDKTLTSEVTLFIFLAIYSSTV